MLPWLPSKVLRDGRPDLLPTGAAQTQVAADLGDALEGLLDTVWRCEADWRFDDRLGLAAN